MKRTWLKEVARSLDVALYSLALVLLGAPHLAGSGLLDALLGKKSGTNNINLGSISQDQAIQGLKEALTKGVEHAITQLGHEGGFLTNLNVKIPLPEKLRPVEKTLRALRQEQLADDFVNTMNHAAEQAVAQAASVFADAIKQMTVADGKAILVGTNDAATRYFRNATQTNLFEKFLPIIKVATDKTGVTASYKRLMAKAGGGHSIVGSLGASILGADALDVDNYVTTKAMDGLFKIVAEEEKRIRQNPVARTSALLQKVFGAVQR